MPPSEVIVCFEEMQLRKKKENNERMNKNEQNQRQETRKEKKANVTIQQKEKGKDKFVIQPSSHLPLHPTAIPRMRRRVRRICSRRISTG